MKSKKQASDGIEVDTVALREFIGLLLEANGASGKNAGVVADHLLEADAMGVRSHGVIRVPQYLDEIRLGQTDPAAEPEIEVTEPARLMVEGRRAFGQVVGNLTADALVPKARKFGIAMAVGRHVGHTGRLGAYAEQLAQRGLVAVITCSGPPSGHWVAPFGGRDPRISTNPMAIAWPVAGQRPVVADFSTAASPEGMIRRLRSLGLQAPVGSLRDADGSPTTDPEVLYGTPRGTIQPFGGDLGYRGTALALFVELSALLAGDAITEVGRVGSNFSMIAIDTKSGFADLAAGLGDHIRSSRPIDSSRPVLMPGDREGAALLRASEARVDLATWASLLASAQAIGISPPPIRAGRD